MKRHWKRWGALYVLAVLFLGSWGGQLIAQIAEVSKEAETRHQVLEWSDVWTRFFSATFENWQSEWLQLLVQGGLLLALRHRIFKADAEDEERREAKLDRLLRAQGIDPSEVEATIGSAAKG